MQSYVWKILFVIEWIIVILVSFRITEWETGAKPGFSSVTFGAGIFLGILIGITSIKLQLSAK